MHILHCVADGHPGGGTAIVLSLCDNFRRRGHDISLVTQPGSYAFNEASRIGITVYGLNFFRSRIDPMTIIQLRRILKNGDPDILHAHGARAGLPSSLMGPRECPWLYSVHGYHFVYKHGPARRLARSAERWISAKADVTLVPYRNPTAISLTSTTYFGIAGK